MYECGELSSAAHNRFAGRFAPLLSPQLLEQVASELRSYLIDSVSQNGGHFAAGLGAVELAVALHYVYQTPHDRLLWDVGHQAYPHKVLTGRRERLSGIKLRGGLAPFPARYESEYDAFGVVIRVLC